jgi:NAD(P)-dependent dehydrogenase (short-subunit alcohol dehydrogenase family)
MDLQVSGRVAFITGGSLGIGYATAEAFAGEGMDLTIVSRTQTSLDRAAETIRAETGRRVLAIAADVTDAGALNAAMATTMETFGRVDVLVNGAAHPGGLVRNEIEQTDPQLLLEDIDIKVIGYVRAIQAAVPYMKAGGFGRIINIGGLTGRGSKQISGLRNLAIVHLTKTLSDQLGPFGITVNVVHPGVVETPHIHELYEKEAKLQNLTPAEVEANYAKVTPIRRVLQPAEIADVLLFLASPRSGAITGESLGIDGGITRGIFL